MVICLEKKTRRKEWRCRETGFESTTQAWHLLLLPLEITVLGPNSSLSLSPQWPHTAVQLRKAQRTSCDVPEEPILEDFSVELRLGKCPDWVHKEEVSDYDVSCEVWKQLKQPPESKEQSPSIARDTGPCGLGEGALEGRAHLPAPRPAWMWFESELKKPGLDIWLPCH